MKIYCEIVVEFLPALRSLIAKTLMDKHKLTQTETAKRLGVTQSAISQYRRNIRGLKTKVLEKDKVIMEEIEKFSERIASGELDYINLSKSFYDLCKSVLHRKSLINLENCPMCFGEGKD